MRYAKEAYWLAKEERKEEEAEFKAREEAYWKEQEEEEEATRRYEKFMNL